MRVVREFVAVVSYFDPKTGGMVNAHTTLRESRGAAEIYGQKLAETVMSMHEVDGVEVVVNERLRVFRA